MKIVSWNCNGKFREKFKDILETDADIFVIQECENPQYYNATEYNNFAINYIWQGENKNKGLGIFAKEDISLNKNNWNSYCLRNFISVNINNKFDLVAVWACKPYIEEYYLYQNINIDKYNNNTIIIGDFNSNKIWDKNTKRNHSKVVEELKEKNLISAYHHVFNEEQGKENQHTFYLYKHLDKGYHIDHCFIAKEKIKEYQILFDEKWLKISDHVPIMLEI